MIEALSKDATNKTAYYAGRCTGHVVITVVGGVEFVYGLITTISGGSGSAAALATGIGIAAEPVTIALTAEGVVTVVDGVNTIHYGITAFKKDADQGKEAKEADSKAAETSYGKSSGKYDTTADFLTNIENRNGKFYTDKATIDKIGQIEARGEDFSLLNKRIMSSRASTEGGTSIVYKYSDELGTKYLIHEVTDARGYIIHRDFDAVRISSGQLINKGH